MCDAPGRETVVALVSLSPAREREAGLLSARLGIPLCRTLPEERGMILVLTPERLELRPNDGSRMGGLWVDFSGGRLAHRSKRSSPRGEAIARAAGMRGASPRRILDATAGLGRDAFILASLGARVIMVEASPWVHALVADGLERARRDSETAAVAERMTLVSGDARSLMADGEPSARPDVIYMDPMFPERGKSSQVKKDLQLLRRLLPSETDPAPMLQMALGHATDRVVIKRPSRAPVVAGPPRSHAIDGKTTRFDVYLTQPGTASEAD